VPQGVTPPAQLTTVPPRLALCAHPLTITKQQVRGAATGATALGAFGGHDAQPAVVVEARCGDRRGRQAALVVAHQHQLGGLADVA
jgi:hypothetical protein